MRKKQWVAAALVGLAVILVGVGSGNVKTDEERQAGKHADCQWSSDCYRRRKEVL